MLRSTFARKVIRLRSLRAGQRTIHGYDAPNGLPVLTDLPPTVEPTRPFPLYQRPPEPQTQYIPLTQETLDSLPSNARLSKELKVKLTKKAIEDLPELQEEDIKRFYKDLVLTGVEDAAGLEHGRLAMGGPEEEQRKLPFPAEERKDILRQMGERLLAPSYQQHQRINESAADGIDEGAGLSQIVGAGEDQGRRVPTHVRVLEALAELAIEDQGQGPSGTSKSPASQATQHARMDIPLGVVSSREWKALFEEFIARKDARGAEALLDIMHLHGVPVDEERINSIMRTDAEAGRVDDVGRLMLELSESGMAITDSHKDCLILSLLRKTPSDPRAAINQLLSAEAAGQPYPQSSYHVAITHLTKPSPFLQPNAQTRAVAWDLFMQMRFAAHPTPSREMYNTMIRTCGEATQPQPERARDLWIEMTESEKIQPTRDEYTALIRALGSTKKDYLEAFDLLRQMLAKHHDATFLPFAEEDEGGSSSTSLPRFSAYVPSAETFTALLEGTKRAGDLNRARWILTESVKLARTGQMLGSKEWMKGVDEDLLSGVFMTYAAWKPVIGRHAVKLKEGIKNQPIGQHAATEGDEPPENQEGEGVEQTVNSAEDEWLDIDVLEELVDPHSITSESQANRDSDQVQSADSQHESERTVVPISSADAIREADALFQRILHDVQYARSSALDYPQGPQDHAYLPFKNVHLTPRLINSYISVHLAHSPTLESAKQRYDDTWSAVAEISGGAVRPNGWTYLHVLEKCSMGNRGGISASDRAMSLAWGQESWESYQTWSENAKSVLDAIAEPSVRARQTWLAGLGERQIERVWRSIIRLQAVHGSVDASLSLLQEFATRYPSTDITRTYAPMPDMGFKVKMSTAATTPEVAVPPYLTFRDVDVLHARLVRTGGPENGWNAEGLTAVKTIIRGYEGRLKERRRWRMRGWQRGRDTRGVSQTANAGQLGNGQDNNGLSSNRAQTQTQQLLEQAGVFDEAEEVEEDERLWEEHLESQASHT
ncbi:hypothetical protein I317_00595 [Kwoniella heveanensis CBS 569]|nr:hypothetical protein I317_00595 [Kwoniella heveanensis CBS 569]